MDSTLIHADIFFFISSIAIIVVGLLLVALGLYALRIVAMIGSIVKKVKQESENVVDDIAALRVKIKEESQKAAGSSFGKFISGAILGSIFKNTRGSSHDRPNHSSSKTRSQKSKTDSE